MTKTNRKILLIIMGISLFCDLLIVGLFLSVAAPPWPETPIDYDDPESLYLLAERTEKYIIRANPDKDSPARKEALKALEDIALLDVSYDEKAKLIRERFPEETFWTDDVKEVLKQAEAGDAEAQFLLGCFYTPKKNLRSSDADLERGLCVIKSRVLAAKWFRKAALQGHAKAQYRLAPRVDELSHKNLSEPTIKRLILDRKEAEEWLAKAGANGEPDALLHGYGPKEKYATEDQSREAGMLRYAEKLLISAQGEPDVPEAEAARMWRQKAFDTAMERLNEGSAEELSGIFPYNITLVHLDEFTRGESREDFVNRIMPRLWELIEHGDYEDAPAFIRSLKREFNYSGFAGLDPDTLCRRFAELGFFGDQEDYAETLMGSAVPEEQAEGVRLLRKLAGFGYPYAQRQLGECCWNGAGVPQDREEGIRWMRMAAEQREYLAMGLLGMYLLQSGYYFESLKWACAAEAVEHAHDSLLEYWFDSTVETIKGLPSTVWHYLGKFALWLFD